MKTIAELIRAGEGALGSGSPSARSNFGSPSARLDTQVLLSHVTGLSRASLVAHPEAPVSEELAERFFALLAKRQRGTPVAYLVNEREFYSLPFFVDESVLIPRPETEELVERAIAHAVALSSDRSGIDQRGKGIRIIDLGTGSGCIAVTLGIELRKRSIAAHIVGVDISPAALSVAQRNARCLNLESIEFCTSDWFSALGGGTLHGGEFDLIVSNPPYVPENSPFVSADTHAEPRGALYSGNDGTVAYRSILSQLRRFLAPDGIFLGEHGIEQSDILRSIAVDSGFPESAIFTHRDLSGRPRFIEIRHQGR